MTSAATMKMQGAVMQGYSLRFWMRLGICAAIISVCALPAQAQEKEAAEQVKEDAAELAKKLSNPVASLISVPLQYNFDTYGGTNDGATVSLLNLQPVIPFSLNQNWNFVTRTIVPLLGRQDFAIDAVNESGLGDIVATQYFSPQSPTAGWIWGVGPAELLPTASNDVLGSNTWGLGPTAVALRQRGPWTTGFLGSHIWSVAGDTDISLTSLQPFASYVTKTFTTFAVLTETTYDWEGEQWSVPLVVLAAQMLKIGPQIFQVAVGGKYWAEAPQNGPNKWGLRVQLTLVFPK
jgi:hypothetical protein